MRKLLSCFIAVACLLIASEASADRIRLYVHNSSERSVTVNNCYVSTAQMQPIYNHEICIFAVFCEKDPHYSSLQTLVSGPQVLPVGSSVSVSSKGDGIYHDRFTCSYSYIDDHSTLVTRLLLLPPVSHEAHNVYIKYVSDSTLIVRPETTVSDSKW